MEDRRDRRAAWVSPVLVQKSLEETRAGIGGTQGDGMFGMQS
jgi:hypothetical protein